MPLNIGIYNLHMRAMGGGEKLTLVLAEHLSSNHNVTFFCSEPIDVASLEQFFNVDLSRIEVSCLAPTGTSLGVIERLRAYSGTASSIHDYRQIKKSNLDIFINCSYASGLICPAPEGIFMCMFPHALSNHKMDIKQRARREIADSIQKLLTKSDTAEVLHSYSTIVAISQYSAEWIRKWWRRDSEIIYPPCENMGPGATKQNILLTVGRFIADAGERHYKNQDVLLNAFKQMGELHSEGWEFHLVGSVAGDENSKKLVEKLQNEARGLPVVFHFNATREELRSLYQKSRIYWHATGYGSNSVENPAKQEHFGITTVEAMSAGAVPVVYGSGGQTEIVTHGVDGLHWSNREELVKETRELVNHPVRLRALGDQAVITSKRFDKETFGAQVDRLIARVEKRIKGR